MSKTMRNLLGGASLALGATVALTGTAIAEGSHTATLDQVSQYNNSAPLAQVNSVFQLKDVAPSDWAFDALRNLVEKYNCIVGYPDGTFRGSRALSRYEFAAGLNACMQQIEKLIAGGGSDVDAADIARLRKLVEEFQAELATLGARVDDLDGRTKFLESHQFSTTTKLNGEVIMTLADVFGGNKDLDSQTTFSDRVRLNLDTSFRADGKDRLRTRLEAGNFTSLGVATSAGGAGTDMARLGHDATGGNAVSIGKLFYRFPVGQKTTAYIGTAGLDIDDIFKNQNPYFYDSGNGALSRFGRFNPATIRGFGGAGVGFNHDVSKKFTISGLYLSSTANDPGSDKGLFNGDYSAGVQLAFAPTSKIGVALTYVNSYGNPNNLSGSTGSTNAKTPFPNTKTKPSTFDATSANNFGLEGTWMVSPKLNLAGWVGYTTANDEEKSGDAQIWNWAANAALLDVGGKGNVLGFIFGQPPKLNDVSTGFKADSGTSYLAELQYRYKLNSNITITPGAYVIFNPNHNDANDTIWVGALRTTFKF